MIVVMVGRLCRGRRQYQRINGRPILLQSQFKPHRSRERASGVARQANIYDLI